MDLKRFRSHTAFRIYFLKTDRSFSRKKAQTQSCQVSEPQNYQRLLAAYPSTCSPWCSVLQESEFTGHGATREHSRCCSTPWPRDPLWPMGCERRRGAGQLLDLSSFLPSCCWPPGLPASDFLYSKGKSPTTCSKNNTFWNLLHAARLNLRDSP